MYNQMNGLEAITEANLATKVSELLSLHLVMTATFFVVE